MKVGQVTGIRDLEEIERKPQQLLEGPRPFVERFPTLL